MRPAFVTPMKAVLTSDRPSGEGWVFERKLDGIRCLAVKDGDRTRLYSRNELSLNDHYPTIAAGAAVIGALIALALLPSRDARETSHATTGRLQPAAA